MDHLKFLVNTGTRLKTADQSPREIYIWEFKHISDPKILSSWAKHFRNHYCSDNEIDFMRDGTGMSRCEYLEKIKFPEKNSKLGPGIRSGDFCEILVADYLEFVANFWVPRVRYDEKAIRNESTKGSDVLGFKFGKTKDDTILAVYEVKGQFSGRKADPRLQEAVDGSIKDALRKAESLNYIKQRLRMQEGIETASKISRFQNEADNPYKEISGAVALFTDNVYDRESIEKTLVSHHPNVDNLELVVFKGVDLMELVHTLYHIAAHEA